MLKNALIGVVIVLLAISFVNYTRTTKVTGTGTVSCRVIDRINGMPIADCGLRYARFVDRPDLQGSQRAVIAAGRSFTCPYTDTYEQLFPFTAGSTRRDTSAPCSTVAYYLRDLPN